MGPEVTPQNGTPEPLPTPEETLRRLKELRDKIQTFNPTAAQPNIDAAKTDRTEKDKLFLQGQYTFEGSVDVHKDIVKTQVQMLMQNPAQWESFHDSTVTQRSRMNTFLKDWKEHQDDTKLKPIYDKAVRAILYFLDHDNIKKDVPQKPTDEQLEDAAYMLAYSEILKKHMDEYDQYRGNFASYRGIFAEKAKTIVSGGATSTAEWNAFVDSANATSQRRDEFKQKNPDASKDNAYVRVLRKKITDAEKKYAANFDGMKTSPEAMTECYVAFELMKEQLDRYAFYESFVKQHPESLPDIIKVAEMEERGQTITPESIAAIMQPKAEEAEGTPTKEPAPGDVAAATPKRVTEIPAPEQVTSAEPKQSSTSPVETPSGMPKQPSSEPMAKKPGDRIASREIPSMPRMDVADIAAPRSVPEVDTNPLRRAEIDEAAVPSSIAKPEPLRRSPSADVSIAAGTVDIPKVPEAAVAANTPEKTVETVTQKPRTFRISFAHYKMKRLVPSAQKTEQSPAAEPQASDAASEQVRANPKEAPAQTQTQSPRENNGYARPRLPLLQRLRARFRR